MAVAFCAFFACLSVCERFSSVCYGFFSVKMLKTSSIVSMYFCEGYTFLQESHLEVAFPTVLSYNKSILFQNKRGKEHDY